MSGKVAAYVVAVDRTGQKGFSFNKKLTTALRLLTYGTYGNALDENLTTSETVLKQCVGSFCYASYDISKDEHPRELSHDELDSLLVLTHAAGFSWKLRNVKCCKREW